MVGIESKAQDMELIASLSTLKNQGPMSWPCLLWNSMLDACYGRRYILYMASVSTKFLVSNTICLWRLTTVLGCLHLIPDIDSACWVFAHQHCSQMRGSIAGCYPCLHFLSNFSLYYLGDLLTIDNLRISSIKIRLFCRP